MGWGLVDNLAQPFNEVASALNSLSESSTLQQAFRKTDEELREVERAATKFAQETAERATRAGDELARKAAEEARRFAERNAQEVLTEIQKVANNIKRRLNGNVPNFNDRLGQVIDEVCELASTAASDGLDITDAVNNAVNIAFETVVQAKDKAISAVNQFLRDAETQLFRQLEDQLPESARFLLQSVRNDVQAIVNDLRTMGSNLVNTGITQVLEYIKKTIQNLVQKVGEVLGPIWQFIKELWRLLFGEEPEHCQLAAKWFEERMKRTEMQFLYKRSTTPISAVIRKRTFQELLPPDEQAWKKLSIAFFDQSGNAPVWRSCLGKLRQLLNDSDPRPGNVVQLTWDQPFKDELGGRQRIQISILYFRWRGEQFRKVSAGFLGILAMLSAVDEDCEPCDVPSSIEVPRNSALEMDAAAMKRIYDELSHHMRLRPMESSIDSDRFTGPRKMTSRQLKFRNDNGAWIAK